MLFKTKIRLLTLLSIFYTINVVVLKSTSSPISNNSELFPTPVSQFNESPNMEIPYIGTYNKSQEFGSQIVDNALLERGKKMFVELEKAARRNPEPSCIDKVLSSLFYCCRATSNTIDELPLPPLSTVLYQKNSTSLAYKEYLEKAVHYDVINYNGKPIEEIQRVNSDTLKSYIEIIINLEVKNERLINAHNMLNLINNQHFSNHNKVLYCKDLCREIDKSIKSIKMVKVNMEDKIIPKEISKTSSRNNEYSKKENSNKDSSAKFTLSLKNDNSYSRSFGVRKIRAISLFNNVQCDSKNYNNSTPSQAIHYSGKLNNTLQLDKIHDNCESIYENNHELKQEELI